MKYYKALIGSINDYITKDFIYRETDHGNHRKVKTMFITISDWIKTLKTLRREGELIEVSKHEYLLFKVKELKDKILDKSNGFYVLYKDFDKFFGLLDSMYIENYHNIDDPSDWTSEGYYIEQQSGETLPQKWTYRCFNVHAFIEQYNLNLIIFEDLINEINEINNEI